MLKVAVAGAAGRMGRTLARMVHENEAMTLAGGLEAGGSPHVGEDMGALCGLGEIGTKITDDALDLLRHVDAVLDFTVPAASVALAAELLLLTNTSREYRRCNSRQHSPPPDPMYSWCPRHIADRSRRQCCSTSWLRSTRA